MNIRKRLIQKLNEQERYPDDLESIVMRDQLFRAIENKDIKQVKELISAGANVNVNVRDETGWTPLHGVAHWGHEDVVKLLISAGADVNAKDEERQTPLHWAVRWGHTDVVKLLISAGTNVNARNIAGRTPLHYAAHQGYENIVKLLKQHGAKE